MEQKKLLEDNTTATKEIYKCPICGNFCTCEEDDNYIHPSHYQSYKKDGIDCLTAMKAAFGETPVAHFCICNAMKYIWRHSSKGQFADIDKAIEYLKLYKDIGIIELGD